MEQSCPSCVPCSGTVSPQCLSPVSHFDKATFPERPTGRFRKHLHLGRTRAAAGCHRGGGRRRAWPRARHLPWAGLSCGCPRREHVWLCHARDVVEAGRPPPPRPRSPQPYFSNAAMEATWKLSLGVEMCLEGPEHRLGRPSSLRSAWQSGHCPISGVNPSTSWWVVTQGGCRMRGGGGGQRAGRYRGQVSPRGLAPASSGRPTVAPRGPVLPFLSVLKCGFDENPSHPSPTGQGEPG